MHVLFLSWAGIAFNSLPDTTTTNHTLKKKSMLLSFFFPFLTYLS